MFFEIFAYHCPKLNGVSLDLIGISVNPIRFTVLNIPFFLGSAPVLDQLKKLEEATKQTKD